MGFNQEIKDFLAAAQAGQKIMGASTDQEYKRAQIRSANATAQKTEDENNDEEGKKNKKLLQAAQIRNLTAAANSTEANTPDDEDNAIERAGKQADIDAKRENAGYIRERSGALADARAAAKADREAAANPPPREAIPAIPGVVGRPSRLPQAAPAIPAVPKVNGITGVQGPDGGVPQSQPTGPLVDRDGIPIPQNISGQYSCGGTVKKFADGGPVEDDEDEPEIAAPTAPATEEPAEEAVPVGGGTSIDISAARRAPGFSHAAAHDAVTSGLKYGVRALGLDGAVASDPARRQRAIAAYSQGAGAIDSQDMESAKKAVDPSGEMGESERNLAALSAVYQFKLNKGDEAGAQRAAFGMIQHYRLAAQRYAAISAAAAEHGDVDGAAKAAMKAYANIPDGRDFKLTKTPEGQLQYSFTDEETGKTIAQGIASPQELGAAAMGVATKGFDEFLLSAAGQRAEGGKGASKGSSKGAVDPSAPAQLKPAEKKEALKAISEAYDAQNQETNADDGTAAPSKRPAQDATDLRGAAFRTYTHNANGHLTPEEAVTVITKIADPAAQTKDAKITTKPVEGGYSVSFDGRQPVVISASDMQVLMQKRRAAEDAKTKADQEAAKPNFVQRTGKFLGEAASRTKKAIDDIHWTPSQEAARRAEFTEPSIP